MINIINKEKCSGCTACVAVCPKNCIEMVADKEGFLYPKVKKNNCTNCGLCEKICPILNKKEIKEENSLAYAVINKDEEIRAKSSSGGIFTELAKIVIEQGGVVFGAGFNEKLEVEHFFVENTEDLYKFRGSKYVQSKIGDTYKQAKKLLKEGRLVYFSGTPCQIGGLLAFLRKPYENLITQDVICHGVPSPKVWKSYIKSKGGHGKVKVVSFKNKVESWTRPEILIVYKNKESYKEKSANNPYIQAFLKNLNLRPSCHNCSFKTKKRESDITLADYWGVENIHPNMDDDKGTSLVIIHSKKGGDFFNKIKDKVVYCESDLDKAIVYNPSMIKSSYRHMNRDIYLRKIKAKKFDEITAKYLRYEIDETLLQRLKLKIKSIIKKGR